MTEAAPPLFQPDVLERFWSKVDRLGPYHPYDTSLGRCWLWTAGGVSGYGQFTFRRKRKRVVWYAHRLAYAVLVSDPGKAFVCHGCDRPSCVNPSHMFLGNSLQNNRDRHAKGRTVTPQALVLTAADAASIRAHRGWLPSAHLAEVFGVSRQLVCDIHRNRSWRHLPSQASTGGVR